LKDITSEGPHPPLYWIRETCKQQVDGIENALTAIHNNLEQHSGNLSDFLSEQHKQAKGGMSELFIEMEFIAVKMGKKHPLIPELELEYACLVIRIKRQQFC
jgi:hypothetical protein